MKRITVLFGLLLAACGPAEFREGEDSGVQCIVNDPSGTDADIPCGPHVLCTKEYPMCILGKCAIDVCGDAGR